MCASIESNRLRGRYYDHIECFQLIKSNLSINCDIVIRLNIIGTNREDAVGTVPEPQETSYIQCSMFIIHRS